MKCYTSSGTCSLQFIVRVRVWGGRGGGWGVGVNHQAHKSTFQVHIVFISHVLMSCRIQSLRF